MKVTKQARVTLHDPSISSVVGTTYSVDRTMLGLQRPASDYNGRQIETLLDKMDQELYILGQWILHREKLSASLPSSIILVTVLVSGGFVRPLVAYGRSLCFSCPVNCYATRLGAE